MIVFDLDDTLYKEADYVASGFRHVVNELVCRSLLNSDDARTLLDSSEPVSDIFDRILSMVGNPAKLAITDILAIYRAHYPEISLDAETEQTLLEFNRLGYRMGIITDGRIVAQQNKIDALNLGQFINPANILISEAIGADKHSAKPFRTIMERNPDQQEFWYIGDNPEKDFYWPNKLGWKTVMLRDDSNRNILNQRQILSKTPADHHATHTIPSLSLLPHLLHNGYYVK